MNPFREREKEGVTYDAEREREKKREKEGTTEREEGKEREKGEWQLLFFVSGYTKVGVRYLLNPFEVNTPMNSSAKSV
jgi:hypothetical protein